MIEFNISDSVADLQGLLETIKDAGLQDVRVNVMGSDRSTTPVPKTRLAHIARIMDAMTDARRKGLTRQELIGLLEDDGLKANTANVYISGAVSKGVLEKNEHGYVLTKKGRELL